MTKLAQVSSRLSALRRHFFLLSASFYFREREREAERKRERKTETEKKKARQRETMEYSRRERLCKVEKQSESNWVK